MLFGAAAVIIDAFNSNPYGVIRLELIFVNHEGIHIMISTLFSVFEIDTEPSIGWGDGLHVQVCNGARGLEVTPFRRDPSAP